MKNRAMKAAAFLAVAAVLSASSPRTAGAQWAPEVNLKCQDLNQRVPAASEAELDRAQVQEIISGKSPSILGMGEKQFSPKERLSMFNVLLTRLGKETDDHCVAWERNDVADAIAGVCQSLFNDYPQNSTVLNVMVRTAASQADPDRFSIDDINNAMDYRECTSAREDMSKSLFTLWKANEDHKLAEKRADKVEAKVVELPKTITSGSQSWTDGMGLQPGF
jgi:hypothetical protein